MANKQCVQVACERVGTFHSRTLCKRHYDELNPTIKRRPNFKRRPIKPTNLPEWEWIKKELQL